MDETIRNRTFFLLLAATALVGCASNEIRIAVDLYDQDPMQPELTQVEVDDIRGQIRSILDAADTLAEQRKDVARQQVEIYQELLKLTLPLNSYVPESSASTVVQRRDPQALAVEIEGDIELARSDLDAHIQWIDDRHAELQAAANAAATSLSRFEAAQSAEAADDGSDAAGLRRMREYNNLRSSLTELTNRHIALAGRADTDLTLTLDTRWPAITVALEQYLQLFNEVSAAPGFGGNALVEEAAPIANQMLESAMELAETMSRVAMDGNSQALQARDGLLDAVQQGDPNNTSNLLEQVRDINNAMSQVPPTLGFGPGGRDALIALSSSRAIFNSQIDRLQDPGDPVWRIVSNPDNQEHWNEVFIDTQFYAQGNSSVVVVRDSPISYRVQRGQNNPTALVRGQLQVSRAIANAAVTIAGARTGAPTQRVPASGSEELGGLQTTMTTAETLARRRALAEESARLRQEANRNLERELERYTEIVNRSVAGSANYDDNDFNASLRALKAILDAHSAFFESSIATIEGGS